MADIAPTPLTALHDAIEREGHVFVPAARMRPMLDIAVPSPPWDAFAASWDDLAVDTWMADQGRYRRRRHAVYAVAADGGIRRQPHQPHYQSLAYNPLNGGVARWFQPVDEAVGEGAVLLGVVDLCRRLFGALAPSLPAWRVEAHQFRIEAQAGTAGRPTPEGVHRDGVDYVLVLLVRRQNIVSGTTTIHAPDGRELGAFTLADPGDATLLDDHRVFHGVTPIEPRDPAQPAWRDVLVVTFKAA